MTGCRSIVENCQKALDNDKFYALCGIKQDLVRQGGQGGSRVVDNIRLSIDGVLFFAYSYEMHEMSIVASILNIVSEELKKNSASRLLVVRVCHGALSNVVPDALQFAFEAQTIGTPFATARLELEEIPLRLTCCACKHSFSPPADEGLFAPCPQCGQPIGHVVEQGDELFVQHIDAE